MLGAHLFGPEHSAAMAFIPFGFGIRRRRRNSGGGGNAVLVAPPSITGTRGGTLNAIPAVFSGATSVSGQWYADGVATGNTTTSFTDSDTSKSLEYRETALPGSVVAKGFLGVQNSAAGYFENFDAYADGTRLASRYINSNLSTYTNTATPNVPGWDALGYFNSPADADGTAGLAQVLRIYGGKVQQTYGGGAWGPYCVVCRDWGSTSGIWEMTHDLELASGTETDHVFVLSVTPKGAGVAPDGIRVNLRTDKSATTNQIILSAQPSITNTTITLPTLTDLAKLEIKLDATAKRIYFWLNDTVAGDAAGYDLSAWTGVWTTKAGFQTGYSTGIPAVGENLYTDLTYTNIDVNSVSSAAINAQPSGIPGKKQVDFTAAINAVGATGAQYKIETEAGEFVQGWTTATFSSGTASGTYLIPDFGYEGQKLKVIVRNVGGTVNVASGLTATNGYVMSTPMWVGINDGGSWAYYENQIPGRDWFTNAHLHWGIIAANPTTSDRQNIMAAGMVADNYQGWAQPYNAATAYPTTSGTNDHNHCRYQGLSWQTTDNTSKVRSAPSTANLSGSGADWKLASDGPADASLVNLNGDGMPTKLPSDTNLTLYFEQAWCPPTANAPFTVACKTQPGIAFKMWGASLGNLTLTQSPADIAAGQFTLNYGTPNLVASSPYNGILIIDRANCTATLDSTFFLSGIASYETGTPSADIGSPYMSAMKSADFDPFAGARYLKPLPIEKFAGSWTGTWTAANNTLGGTTFWLKYIVDTANRLGHKYVHVNIPWPADASYVTAIATYLRDNLNPGILIFVEKSNEDWNGIYLGAQELTARANALASTDAAYQKPYLLHCREHNAMVASFKTVFGAAYTSRVQPALAWQSVTSITTWQQMLDFENTWQNVGRVSIAPYVDSGVGNYTASPNTAWAQDALQAAVGSSNQAAFNTALNTFMSNATDYEVGLGAALFNFLPGYSISKGLSKNAIQMLYYEGGWFITNSTAGWDGAYGAGAGTRAISYFDQWKRSSTGGGAFFARYLDQLAQKAPGAINCFVYVGGSNSWGLADGMGKTTQEPMATILTKCAAYNA